MYIHIYIHIKAGVWFSEIEGSVYVWNGHCNSGGLSVLHTGPRGVKATPAFSGSYTGAILRLRTAVCRVLLYICTYVTTLFRNYSRTSLAFGKFHGHVCRMYVSSLALSNSAYHSRARPRALFYPGLWRIAIRTETPYEVESAPVTEAFPGVDGGGASLSLYCWQQDHCLNHGNPVCGTLHRL